MFKISKLNKSFKIDKNKYDNVLKDINFTIEQGSFTTIVGESGSGKSTLLNLITTLDRDYEGEITYKNINLTKISSAKLLRTEVGFIFQNFNLINDQNVYQNIEQGLLYIKNIKRKKAIKEALKSVGMEKYAKKKISKLSGGQKQRVAIARAIVKNPAVIIADEPTGSLDLENRDIVIDILKQLNAQGKTIIMVTHDPDLAKIGNQVITMKDGQITNIMENETAKTDIKNSIEQYDYRKNLRMLDVVKATLSQYKRRIFRIILSVLGLVIGSGVLIGINALQTTFEKQLDLAFENTNVTEEKAKFIYVETNSKTSIDEVLNGYTITSKQIIGKPIKTAEGISILAWDDSKIKDSTVYYSQRNLDTKYIYDQEELSKEQENIRKIESGEIKSKEEYEKLITEPKVKSTITLTVNDQQSTLALSNLDQIVNPANGGFLNVPPQYFSSEENIIWVTQKTYDTFYEKLTKEEQAKNVKYYKVEFESIKELEKFQKDQKANQNIVIGSDNAILLQIRKVIQDSFLVLFVITGFISLISVATILIISYIRIRDGRKEYAIRKVLGFSNKDLAKYSVIDNTFQILIGFGLGYTMFIALKEILTALTGNQGFIRIENPTLGFMAMITIGTGIFVMLVTMILTRKIKKVDPAEALRYE